MLPRSSDLYGTVDLIARDLDVVGRVRDEVGADLPTSRVDLNPVRGAVECHVVAVRQRARASFEGVAGVGRADDWRVAVEKRAHDR